MIRAALILAAALAAALPAQADEDASARAAYREAMRSHKASMHREIGEQFLVERDVEQALVWLERAGEMGDAKAQAHLARLYAAGLGKAADYERAAYWVRKSSGEPGR